MNRMRTGILWTVAVISMFAMAEPSALWANSPAPAKSPGRSAPAKPAPVVRPVRPLPFKPPGPLPAPKRYAVYYRGSSSDFWHFYGSYRTPFEAQQRAATVASFGMQTFVR